MLPNPSHLPFCQYLPVNPIVLTLKRTPPKKIIKNK